jgi:hypothetical protein
MLIAGYLEAQELARKLVAAYRLCSEQLSSQSHYDYGMRAVISVLRAAGANRQKFPELPEGLLMLRSIRDVNAPKFHAQDIVLFDGILSDLFPGTVLPAADYRDLDAALAAACEEMNLQTPDVWITKVRAWIAARSLCYTHFFDFVAGSENLLLHMRRDGTTLECSLKKAQNRVVGAGPGQLF